MGTNGKALGNSGISRHFMQVSDNGLVKWFAGEMQFSSAAALGSVLLAPILGQEAVALRPPAIPLVAHDPYFSAWLPRDQLASEYPTHWSGSTQALVGVVRIDGKAWRFLGREPAEVPELPQVAMRVGALASEFDFAQDDVRVKVRFCSPAFADDPEVASRALTFLSIEVRSATARKHDLSLST